MEQLQEEEEQEVVFLALEGKVMGTKTLNNNKHHPERTPFDLYKLKHLLLETPLARTLRRYARVIAATKMGRFLFFFQKINKNLLELHF